MKRCNKFLEEILPYPTEGEDDNDLIDLDTILNTNVGSDRNIPDESEADKTARLAKEATDAAALEAKKKEEGEGEGEGEGDTDLSNLELLQGLNSDEVSDEQKDLKKEILDHFKGESIDAEGNILDKDGNIVAEFDKVDKFITDEPTFDKDGNQVDEEGKVIKTKSHVEFEKSAIGGVIAELPYELKDESGKPIVYEDTVEGYTKLAKDIANIELEGFKESFLESNPVLREVGKHLLAGGKLEDFNNPVDYTKIDTKKLSENDKLDLVRNSFMASGLDKERSDDLVDLIKQGGKLDAEVTKAIGILDSSQKLQQKTRDTAYQKSIDDENTQVVQYWSGVKGTLDKGKLGGIDIPKTDQEAFFKYISTPVDTDGNSQETLDMNKEGLESDLMMRFYRYKKYNLGSIVTKELGKSKVNTLREKINKANKSKSSTSSRKTSTSNVTGEVSLNDLLN